MLYPLKTEKANLELVLDSGPARVEFEEVDYCERKYRTTNKWRTLTSCLLAAFEKMYRYKVLRR